MLTSKLDMAETGTTAQQATEARPHRRDWTGGGVGIVVFLVGIGLLLLTFRLAYNMFTVPPEQVLRVQPGKPIDLAESARAFVGVVIRVLLLLVMATISAIVANRGIKMYSDASHGRPAR